MMAMVRQPHSISVWSAGACSYFPGWKFASSDLLRAQASWRVQKRRQAATFQAGRFRLAVLAEDRGLAEGREESFEKKQKMVFFEGAPGK